MAEAANLLEKYQAANNADVKSFEIRQGLEHYTPGWDHFGPTKGRGAALHNLKIGDDAGATLKILQQENYGIARLMVECLSAGDEKLAQYVLTVFYDMLRGDSSTFSIFEEGNLSVKAFQGFMNTAAKDPYGCDKAAWLVSAAMGHVSGKFSEEDVKGFLTFVVGSNGCSETGVLEAITNLLKSDTFRKAVWSFSGVPDRVLKIEPKTDSAPYLYRCVFAIWMLSFDADIPRQLKDQNVVPKMKAILVHSRTEKVVRLSLTVLKNFLNNKGIAEDIAEEGLHEAVQNLEYEKWRDADLYEEIRDTSQLIGQKVQEISNFDRYEKELQTGKLQWGFVHSSKFWSENVNKFETNDFRAIKHLASLLNDMRTDKTTLAVVCHDLGEFVTLHPLGKKKLSQLQVKDRIMNLMGSTDPEEREVRREALLCCQKIMLNKWSEIEK